MSVTRTNIVKQLDEGFLYAVRRVELTIEAARSVGQRITALTATTLIALTTAARGAGYVGSGGAAATVSAYAVAISAIRSATTVTIGAETALFPAFSPPGTAIPFTGVIDIQAAPTIAGATVGDKIAIVEQPPALTDANLIDYVTSKSGEPLPLTRDIRDRGVLRHRKKMSQEGGTLTLSEKFQNFATGLPAYVDQDLIVVVEREDNRCGVVTEKEIYYGAHIEMSPSLNETEGDTDTDMSPVITYELRAVVGEDLL